MSFAIEFCVVFLKGSKYLICGGEIFSLWFPYRLTRKQECLQVFALQSALRIAEWPLSSVVPSWHTPAWVVKAVSSPWPEAGRDLALPALQPHLCNSLCSSTPGPLSIHETYQPLSCPPDSAGTLPLFVNAHAHRHTCTHTCALTHYLQLTLSVPKREPQSRLLGSAWLPPSPALCPWTPSPLPLLEHHSRYHNSPSLSQSCWEA